MALTADAPERSLAASALLLLCPHVLFSSARMRITSPRDTNTRDTETGKIQQSGFVKESLKRFFFVFFIVAVVRVVVEAFKNDLTL